MLTIDEPTWNALLDEARAVIDRRNAQCTGNYAKYSHSLRIQDSEHYTLAIAEQKGGWRGVERHGLGWRKSTGALHGLKFTKMKGAANRGQYYMQPKPQPKSWDRLNGKPVTEILKKTGLVPFIMIHVGEAYYAGSQSSDGTWIDRPKELGK